MRDSAPSPARGKPLDPFVGDDGKAVISVRKTVIARRLTVRPDLGPPEPTTARG
jgi:hypothetical protein